MLKIYLLIKKVVIKSKIAVSRIKDKICNPLQKEKTKVL